MIRFFCHLLLIALLYGCSGTPDGIEPVTGFEVERYVGKWYEIARLDHSFERGLQQISAEYSLRDDGGLNVVNRGFASDKGEWKEAQGKAYFVSDSQTGHLKVSFFGPFYGAYVIFELDHEGYQYAFVTGPSRDYLWLLARTPQIDDTLKSRFIDRSAQLGFNTQALIFVNQLTP